MLAIATLANGKNSAPLKKTIESFLKNCSHRPLVWAIFDNGSSGELYEYIRHLPHIPDVLWIKERSDIDIGLGAGVNRANNLVKDAEFVLFLEHDWELLSAKESGAPENWLDEIMEFMTKNNRNYVHLRRYTNDDEARFHGWTENVIRNAQAQDGDFILMDHLRYSNNPHLRRNKELYSQKVLPLTETFDSDGVPLEHKWHPSWCKSENSAPPVENSCIYKWGVFVHAWPESRGEKAGCGRYSEGASTCKYGFFEWNFGYCGLCDANKNWSDLYDHDARLNNCTNAASYEAARNQLSNPCVPLGYTPLMFPINRERRRKKEQECISSLLIASRNRPEVLRDCLLNLFDTCAIKDEVIVLVHQSWDQYESVRNEFESKAKFIRIDYDCSLSHIWNKMILLATHPVVFLISDKARPSISHINSSINLLSEGYGLVGLYRFAFVCFSKYLINKIGWFDERFEDGGWEDFDAILRLREADIAYYENDIVPIVKIPSAWTHKKSKNLFEMKWKIGIYGVRTERNLPEENLYQAERQNYAIFRTGTDYLPYSQSILVPYNWYTPFVNNAGERFSPKFAADSINDDPHLWTR